MLYVWISFKLQDMAELLTLTVLGHMLVFLRGLQAVCSQDPEGQCCAVHRGRWEGSLLQQCPDAWRMWHRMLGCHVVWRDG